MGDWIQAAVFTLFVLALVWAGTRPVSPSELSRFAGRFSLSVDTMDFGLVSARLRRSRKLRSVAVAVGFTVGALPVYVNLIDRESASSFSNFFTSQAWLIGAAFGAMMAELLVVQRPTRQGKAALIARRPGDYVATGWFKLVAFLTLVAVAATMTAAVSRNPLWGRSLAGAAGAVIAVALIWLGLRTITDRPLLAPDGPLRDTDEALRAYGAHHLVGAGIALTGGATSIALSPLTDPVPLVEWITLFCWLGSLGLWRAVAFDLPWRAGHPMMVPP
jgi:hypothetical protein